MQGAIICNDSDWDGNRLNVDPGIACGYIRYSNGVHGYNTAGTGPEYEVCGTGGQNPCAKQQQRNPIPKKGWDLL